MEFVFLCFVPLLFVVAYFVFKEQEKKQREVNYDRFVEYMDDEHKMSIGSEQERQTIIQKRILRKLEDTNRSQGVNRTTNFDDFNDEFKLDYGTEQEKQTIIQKRILRELESGKKHYDDWGNYR